MRRRAFLKKRVSSGADHAYRGGKLKKGQEFLDWLEVLRDKTTSFEEEVTRIRLGQRIRGHVI